MVTPKFIECSKCGKMIPKEELAEHSKWHSEHDRLSTAPPNDTIEESYPMPPFKPKQHKVYSKVATVVFAVLLITIGLVFLLGFTKYWPLILVVMGIMVIINISRRKS